MRQIFRVGILTAVIIVAFFLYNDFAQDSDSAVAEPSKKESVLGDEFTSVTLAEKEAQRLGIETVPAREEWVARSQAVRIIVPYASIIYGLHGETWVYTSTEPRKYLRQEVSVDLIDGGTALLLKGPQAGTEVVTVGVAELFGAETGIGK